MSETAVTDALDLHIAQEAHSGGRVARAGRSAVASGTRSTRVARNLIFVMSSQMFVWLAASALVVVVPRYLGSANLGKLTFATSLSGFAVTLALFGTNTFITREIARRPEAAGHITYNALITRLPLVILVGAAMVAFVNLPGLYSPSTKHVVYVGVGWMVLGVYGFMISSALQGLERMGFVSVVSIVEKAVLVVFGIGALTLAGQGMMTYAVIILLAGVVPTVAQLIYFTRLVGLSWQFDRNLSIQLFRGGIPFFLWSVSLVIYGTIDVTLLSLMTRDEVVGWYGTAYRFIGVSVFLPFALTMALFPSLSSATGDEFKALARRSLDAVILTSLPVALFLAIGASAIISFFRWGDDFQHAVVPLQILAIHVPMVSVSMVAATVLLAKNREGARTRMAMVAGVLNTLANLALIPFFTHYNDNGAIGAAIVTVFTEVFMMTGTIYLIGPGVFARANLVTCVRCMAAGAVMSGAMVLVRPYGMLPIMVAGGLTYPVAALAFGATNFAELRELLALIRARGAKTGSVDPEAAA